MTVADFKNIRDNVRIEEVAAWLGLQPAKKMFSEQLRVECPVNGGGKRALVITPSKNRYFCFCPDCNEGGDAIQLTAKVRQIPARDAALALQAQFLNHTYRNDFAPQEKLAKVEEKLIFEHEAVQALGLTPDQARLLGIGFMKGGTMPGRILVPIRTRDGVTTGYIGLAPGSDVKLPKTFHV